MLSPYPPTVELRSQKTWIWWMLRLRRLFRPDLWTFLGCAAMACPAHADADDYGPTNRGWNGLSELTAIARSAGVDVRVAQRIDLHALTPKDGLLIVYPTDAPPRP